MPNKIDYVSIEYVHGSWWFCENGVYPESSVLAGMDFRRLMTPYQDNLEAAKAAHPEAEVIEGGDLMPFIQGEISHTPPEWFDESNAGERWDDDY